MILRYRAKSGEGRGKYMRWRVSTMGNAHKADVTNELEAEELQQVYSSEWYKKKDMDVRWIRNK